jgi:hypothetical protein
MKQDETHAYTDVSRACHELRALQEDGDLRV